MNEPGGILIFGPNCGGKTTLGRELASRLGWKRMDSESTIILLMKVT